MSEQEQYKALISEVIAKQGVILGPEIAVLKARGVARLQVDDKGTVIDIKGDPEAVLEELIDQYVELSGQIVKSALTSVFTKYPEIHKKVKK